MALPPVAAVAEEAALVELLAVDATKVLPVASPVIAPPPVTPELPLLLVDGAILVGVDDVAAAVMPPLPVAADVAVEVWT